MSGPAARAARAAAALTALAGAWAASAPALAQGCAMCGTALGGPEDPLAKAISWSILFMVSMPFAIVASIGGWLVLAARRAGRRPEPASEPAGEPARPEAAASAEGGEGS